ncbi:phosphotransferase enzyme family protein [Hoyosella subflava]|uniref:Aminoglycoside phosphotransferase n=1 Tax=Hoyosella subflava (strain DSM 45089 / JCM 17490 / NBRC 109087 / DQS3-9A1) TaxID=443218 RepID=F6EKT1_HOYSD|nr:aminoglycoside phosphotransferase family protein [Hoyosella subflava]AEF41411.1 Aminoglycoside phosphotransferase [Hoyosella subflava DQS3-9A1]
MSEPTIRSWVEDDFGMALHAVTAITEGADATAQTWRGTADDGERYAIKLSRGATAGLSAQAHLARHNVHGVPAPLLTRSGSIWSIRSGKRLSVIPWIEGRPGSEMTTEHWCAFGRLLARVHSSHVPEQLGASLRAVSFTPHSLLDELADVRSALARPVTDSLVTPLAAIWATHAGDIAYLASISEMLGARLQDRAAPAVLCHTDAHAGNIVWNEHGVYLLDWDDAELTPPERDLMFIDHGGVLASAPVTEEQQASFYRGYWADRDDRDRGESGADSGTDSGADRERMLYFHCVRALTDVRELAAVVLDEHTWDRPQRVKALEHTRDSWGPSGHASRVLAMARQRSGTAAWS